MAKRISLKTATVCGMTFQAATVNEAKERGTAAVTELAHEANIGPSLYRVAELSVLVWPHLEGWSYRVLRDSDSPGIVQANCTMGGTRGQCIASAVAHAAMMQWDISKSTHWAADNNWLVSAFWPARKLAGSSDLGLLLDKASENCRDQMAWQHRYRAVRDMGAPDVVCHDIACRTRSVDDAIAAYGRKEVA